jgi:hypothetical protein
MEIATKHAEAESQRPGTHMEKRLLLYRIALHPADIAPRNVQFAAAVEADLTNARLAVRDGAAVAAGIAPDTIPIHGLPEVTLSNVLCQDLG